VLSIGPPCGYRVIPVWVEVGSVARNNPEQPLDRADIEWILAPPARYGTRALRRFIAGNRAVNIVAP
jgi:hypothetical protein